MAAVGKFIGQRMRFFGDRDGDARRFFHAEPARKSMKSISEKMNEK
ncbi:MULTISPECIES: hypothetical protein [unclassified Massilia]|nr:MULTISPECIES: hypothetical protein [unclassified Massilia]